MIFQTIQVVTLLCLCLRQDAQGGQLQHFGQKAWQFRAECLGFWADFSFFFTMNLVISGYGSRVLRFEAFWAFVLAPVSRGNSRNWVRSLILRSRLPVVALLDAGSDA